MNLKIVLILLALAVATILALVCVLLSGSKPATCGASAKGDLAAKHDDKSLVFADLSPAEFTQVVDYLKKNLGHNLVDSYHAYPSDNCIYSIDLQLPKKEEVLAYLDREGPKPTREALVVVYFGSLVQPKISEIVVSPLPNPTGHRDVTQDKYKGGLPYHRRPVIGKEYMQVYSFIQKEMFSKASRFLKEVLTMSNEEDMAILTSAPRGYESGDRATWFVIFQNTPGSGFFLHPVGLEVLVDHKSLNISQWTWEKVFYNGEYYNSMAELEEQFKANKVKVVKMVKFPPGDEMGSLKARSVSTAATPLQYEPHGPRYSVKNNQVLFQAWSFAFGINVNSGVRLFDIKFNGERVVYELSVQEAMSVYGSNAPGGMMTRYMDSHFGIGRYAFELVRGVDCPYMATYVDSDHFIDTQKSVKSQNCICIFEQNSALPLRRHYSNFHSLYYGGLPNTVLVLRTISTLGNYDYVFDFLFYQNGAIESRVHATGYISSSFYYADGLNYGNRVGEHTLGTIHTHFVNYKVDLDVAGTTNHVEAHDMEFETFEVPWSKTKKTIQRPKVTRRVLENESQTAFEHHSKMPRYMQFASKQTNKWGHKRAYRIQIVSFAGDYLPEESSIENSMNWARYKLAITKRKEEEPQSSSIYNQNDPWTPTVKFSDFLNGEDIQDQDLVAWITTGFLHIPHAEDIPNTVTAGNGVHFLLRPYNYFNEDPSVDSPDAVYFTSDQQFTTCAVNPVVCLAKTGSCSPSYPPFTYNGLDNSMLFL